MPTSDSLQIEPSQVKQMLESGGTFGIVDIRQSWEHKICHIDGSLLLPMDELPARLSELPMDRPLVIVCHHGMRSFHATMWLRQNGFPQAMNLAGGVDAWAAQIDSSMARY